MALPSPNPTASGMVCDSLSCHFPTLSSQEYQIHCRFRQYENQLCAHLENFFPHSDLTGRGEPHANIELPFERCGDTQNCLLTFAFDKKAIWQFAYPPLPDSSLAMGIVMYQKENPTGTDVHLYLSSVCKYVT